MKKQTISFLLVLLVFSLSCQFLFPPAREGTVISNCESILSDVSSLQALDTPDYLLETGIKQGGEFDANEYFNVLTHVSMQEGYVLDYVYPIADLGASPILYARPVDQAPYLSMDDIPENTDLPDFRDYLEVEDVEQGYFEYVVLDLLAGQFYLFWHSNYNDTQIVCDKNEVNDIVKSVSAGDFGYAMDFAQQTQARAMKNIEPSVRLTEDSAIVQIIIFTKWGGFYRYTYTISRTFPHTIIDLKQDNLVPYDCGVMF
ncbi:MAG: hypothetical protein AB1649_12405 [Chloroflexota bacterium]